MEYTAPDGHIIISSPNNPVTYTCSQEGMTEGIFFSLETKSDSTIIGIQQIQITRTISTGSITIQVVESTDAELEQYKIDVDGVPTNDEIITNLLNNQ
jgi:hypothetical protein